MKERKNLFTKVKQMCNKYTFAVVASIFILAFIVGFIFSMKVFCKTLTDTQFNQCEQVARNVYAQKDNSSIYIPEEFSVKRSNVAIIVKLANSKYLGRVIAMLDTNGKLIIARDNETGIAVQKSCFIGSMFCLASMLLMHFAIKIYEKFFIR